MKCIVISIVMLSILSQQVVWCQFDAADAIDQEVQTHSGFIATPVNGERQSEIWKSMEVTLKAAPEKRKSICCFDVNETGWFVLGYNGVFGKASADVYNETGEFQYGVSFFAIRAFALELDEPYLSISGVSGGIIKTINQNGELVAMKEAVDNGKSGRYNEEYWEYLRSSRRIVGNNQYVLSNGFPFPIMLFSPNFSIAKRINQNGEVIVFYDVRIYHLLKTIAVTTLIISVCCYAVFLIHKKMKETIAIGKRPT